MGIFDCFSQNPIVMLEINLITVRISAPVYGGSLMGHSNDHSGYLVPGTRGYRRKVNSLVRYVTSSSIVLFTKYHLLR